MAAASCFAPFLVPHRRRLMEILTATAHGQGLHACSKAAEAAIVQAVAAAVAVQVLRHLHLVLHLQVVVAQEVAVAETKTKNFCSIFVEEQFYGKSFYTYFDQSA